MKKALVLLAFLFSTAYSNAQWQYTNGPTNGSVHALAANGTGIFAGTSGGVHLHTSNWASVSGGVLGPHQINGIGIIGSNIFAGVWLDMGVYLSTNDGGSWTEKINGLPYDPVGAFLCSIYDLRVYGSTVYIATDQGMVKTVDNGTNWTLAGLIDTSLRAVATNGVDLFAGTYFNYGVFHSTDNGNSWTQVNNGLPSEIVHSLAIIGTTIFAGTTTGGYISSDNGANWSSISDLASVGTVHAFEVTGPANIFAGTTTGVFVSDDNGSTWTAASTGLTTLDILSFVTSGTDLYVGTDGGGVWKRPINEMSTGIFEVAKQNIELDLYPNPASTTATISMKGYHNKNLNIKIFDVFGKAVIQMDNLSGNTFTFGIEGLKSGIYFLQLTDGDANAYRKFLIE